MFAEPFGGRWAFDVELIGRLSQAIRADGKNPERALVELPLSVWHDRAGSKRTLLDYGRTAVDLGRIFLALKRASSAPPRRA